MKLDTFLNNDTHDLLTVERLPAEWKLVLDMIQTKYPQAKIAGGAIRDVYFEKSIKDVDIFVKLEGRQSSYWIPTMLEKIESLKMFETKITKRDVKQMENYFFENESVGKKLELIESNAKAIIRHNEAIREEIKRPIFYIYKFERSIGLDYKYDIIFGNDAATSINNFDMSICQIEFDGKNIIKTPEFILTEQTKVIKVCNINRVDRQKSRIQRIKEKFDDCTMDDSICAVDLPCDDDESVLFE